MLHAYTAHCPYCGESFETSLDPSVQHQEYIEDCQVCCSPIIFDVVISFDSDDNVDAQVQLRRDNE